MSVINFLIDCFVADVSSVHSIFASDNNCSIQYSSNYLVFMKATILNRLKIQNYMPNKLEFDSLSKDGTTCEVLSNLSELATQ